jgi:hypothetical protein
VSPSMRMWMLGENPEPPKVNHPERKFSQGGKWLRLLDDYRTLLVSPSKEVLETFELLRAA